MAEQVVATPADAEHISVPPAEEAKGDSLIVRAVDGLWRLLRHPWLLVTLLVLLGAILLWARMLPQIPGQLTESAADTTRWLNATLASTSILGADLARSLGLFDLYTSPWLRILLTAVTLLAAVQIADAIGALNRWRGLAFEASTGEVAEPVSLMPEGVARERLAIETVPERVAELALEWATKAGMSASTFARVAATMGVEEPMPALENAAAPESAEERLLFRKRGWSAWVVPLLSIGALLGALLLWANVFMAWNVRPDVLPPGASFESTLRGLYVSNAPDWESLPDKYWLRLNGQRFDFSPDGRWRTMNGLGAARVRANNETPALVVQTDDPILSLPSAPQPQNEVGVLLPGPGSEQFVVLPGQGIGLRLVRINDGNEDQYWAEVYDEEAVQPIVRERVEGSKWLEIPVGDETLKLFVGTGTGLQVEVERGFGRLLWLPALLMILAGIVALLLPARMLLLQLSPWEKERTLLIAQATSSKDLAALTSALNT